MKINKDLKNYLDNLNLNYNILITDESCLVYSNMNIQIQEMSNELKAFLYKIRFG